MSGFHWAQTSAPQTQLVRWLPQISWRLEARKAQNTNVQTTQDIHEIMLASMIYHKALDTILTSNMSTFVELSNSLDWRRKPNPDPNVCYLIFQGEVIQYMKPGEG